MTCNCRYAACFLSIAGGSPAGPLDLAWGTDNAAPDTVRAIVTAVIPGMISPLCLIHVYRFLGIGALGSVIAYV